MLNSKYNLYFRVFSEASNLHKSFNLEGITEKLSKQVADQNNEIKDLKIKLVESENRTLKRLQQQIDALVESNDQKERDIKNLERDAEKRNKPFSVEEQEQSNTVDEQEQGNTVDEQELTPTLEEAVVRDERCEVEDIDDQWGEEQERARRFFMDSLSMLSELEDYLQKCWRNGKVCHKYKLCCDQILKKGGERLEPLKYSTHKDFIDLVKEMKSVITKSEKEKSKFDKDDCIKNIREFRQSLYQLDPCTM